MIEANKTCKQIVLYQNSLILIIILDFFLQLKSCFFFLITIIFKYIPTGIFILDNYFYKQDRKVFKLRN